MKKSAREKPRPPALHKCPSGIHGLDEITDGGLPKGRPTLVTGGAGCGKTLFSMEFLVRGAQVHGEPGVFMAFEENIPELMQNVASLGFDLEDLVSRKKIWIDHVRVERSEIQETGEYDLEGLFIRLGHAIDSIGAKRVVLDTVDSLFGGIPNEAILRSELRRLFRWLKAKGVTSIITAEKGDSELSRHGLEEYVADCVILLDHRVNEQLSTRRLRVVKYRGSYHGTNEFPFLIGNRGIFLIPITSAGLDYKASIRRISTGIPKLDAMMGGKGYYAGSSILVTGTSGTGKSIVAASFTDAACRRGVKCQYFAFEESREQIFRNMRSVGNDLARWEKKGFLHLLSARPTISGLEQHMLTMMGSTREMNPEVVIIDPISNMAEIGNKLEVKLMFARMIDFFKTQGITTLFTSLVHGGGDDHISGVGISSLMDTWLQLVVNESDGEHRRALYIMKSRGMPHSNHIREFTITNNGIVIHAAGTA